MKTCSWSDLGRSWGGLGRPWGGLGPLLEPLGAVSGGSWGLLGRSKIDQQIDPKLDTKISRIATENNGPNTTPVVVSAIDKAHREPDPASLEIYRNRF